MDNLELGQSLKQIIKHRLEKIKILRNAGVNPFPHNFNLKDKISDLLNVKEPFTKKYQTAGRVIAIRRMGKASFCHVQDEGKKIQIYLKNDLLKEGMYDLLVRNLDIGDIVGFNGILFYTKTNELSIKCTKVTILSKSIRPLPNIKEKEGESFFAFEDKRLRYRNRHLDLIVNPSVKDAFIIRSKTINEIKQLIGIDPENPLRFKNKTGRIFIEKMQPKLEELLRGKRFDDIAAATQEWFEKLTTTWVSNAIEKTKVHKIACSGGTFLNVKANRAILSLDCVEDAFFCPAAGDDGLAVAAALTGYYELVIQDGISPNHIPLKSNYFGTSFSNEEIESSLKKHNLLENAQFVDDIDDEIGELISKPDTIVARFSGAMEWGPRGLGNRSILADPSNPNIVRKINKAIKMRDFWMPFGPSILSSRMDEYLIDAEIAPYMILAFDTTEKRNDLAAAIHPYDLTCRPQTVNSEYNKNYETVLKSFESKTGIGGILNTSFNLHGFPIVYSPDIAINTFKNSKLDVLSLGNYLIKK